MTIHDQFRTKALGLGFAESEVGRWAPRVRLCGVHRDDGEVVGHFGGPLLVPDQVRDCWLPLVATIACAAIPPGVTDLVLPPDGQLLFFGYPEEDDSGEVLYVPPGTEVSERSLHPDAHTCSPYFDEVCDQFPQGDIRLVPGLSLPFVDETEMMVEALATDWGSSGRRFLLGGHGTACNGMNPADMAAYSVAGDAASDDHDWILLAELDVEHPASGGATMFWMIRRHDLVARRFEQVLFLADYNP
ncbi:DUF1963 domain-containing protein [Lentzea sp. NPDC058450]|uniref:DUF1963 domain-containing protein n=1 Tax=Lentzea sp. NPDC058450 TaxID=3346505 RepID=UPI003669841F